MKTHKYPTNVILRTTGAQYCYVGFYQCHDWDYFSPCHHCKCHEPLMFHIFQSWPPQFYIQNQFQKKSIDMKKLSLFQSYELSVMSSISYLYIELLVLNANAILVCETMMLHLQRIFLSLSFHHTWHLIFRLLETAFISLFVSCHVIAYY